MTDYEAKKAIVEDLEFMAEDTTPMYAIFFDGKQIICSKVRVYKQKSRAIAELTSSICSQLINRAPDGSYTTYKDYGLQLKEARRRAKEILAELEKEGRLEIKIGGI